MNPGSGEVTDPTFLVFNACCQDLSSLGLPWPDVSRQSVDVCRFQYTSMGPLGYVNPFKVFGAA